MTALSDQVLNWLQNDIACPNARSLTAKDLQITCQHEMVSVWKFLTTRTRTESQIVAAKKLFQIEQKYGKQNNESIKAMQEKARKDRKTREKLLEERAKLRLAVKSTKERVVSLQAEVHRASDENTTANAQLEQKQAKAREIKQRLLLKATFLENSKLLSENQHQYAQVLNSLLARNRTTSYQGSETISAQLQEHVGLAAKHTLLGLVKANSSGESTGVALQGDLESILLLASPSEVFAVLTQAFQSLLKQITTSQSAFDLKKLNEKGPAGLLQHMRDENSVLFIEKLANSNRAKEMEINVQHLRSQLITSLKRRGLSDDKVQVICDLVEVEAQIMGQRRNLEFVNHRTEQLSFERSKKGEITESLKVKQYALQKSLQHVEEKRVTINRILSLNKDVQQIQKAHHEKLAFYTRGQLVPLKAQLSSHLTQLEGSVVREVETFTRHPLSKANPSINRRGYKTVLWDLGQALGCPAHLGADSIPVYINQLQLEVAQWAALKKTLGEQFNGFINKMETKASTWNTGGHPGYFPSLAAASSAHIAENDEKLLSAEVVAIKRTLDFANQTERLFSDISAILQGREKLTSGASTRHLVFQGRTLASWIEESRALRTKLKAIAA